MKQPNNVIDVEILVEYGNRRVYVRSENGKKLLKALNGKQVLKPAQIKALEEVGIVFNLIVPTLEEKVREKHKEGQADAPRHPIPSVAAPQELADPQPQISTSQPVPLQSPGAITIDANELPTDPQA